MARIAQYKALGTSLGGYKSTLSKVQSMEYAKKHSDWKAEEQKSLYNEIGGTVSNILGIAKEKILSDRQKARQEKFDAMFLPKDKPDRPQVSGPEMYSPEELTAEDMPSDFDASAPIPGLESSWDEGMKGEQSIGEAPAEIDYSGAATAGQGATQYRKITPKPEGAGALPIGTGVPFAEKGGMKGGEDMSAANAMVDQWIKEDADNPLFNKEKLEELEAGDRNVARAREIEDEKKRMIAEESNQNVQSAYQGPVDAKSLALEMADMEESGLPKPTRPEVTDDFYGDMKNPNVDDVKVDDIVFDSVKYAEDYEALKTELDKPTPYKPGIMEAAGLKYLQKMPGFEGLRGSDFDQLFQEWMGTESAGRNVRQEINKGELGTGKGTGRAGGLWQMERGFDKDAEGELKGRGFQTSIQRFINMNKMFGEKVPAWVADAKEKDTPEDLTPQQQRELVFANMFMQEQSYGLSGSLDKQGKRITGINISSEDVGVDRRFDILRRSYQKGNYGELWARKHYAGAKPGSELYKEKIEQFERDKERAREYRYK